MDMYHIKPTLSDITNQCITLNTIWFISVNLKNPFWSDVLLCLSEAKPHTDSSVNDILSLDILCQLDFGQYYL
jgi:hypothetical protein